MKVVVASAIIGVSAIFSAAMISGNIDFKKQNIVNTDNGHVSLGEVYSESALVDVELRLSDDNSKIFVLTGLSYESYMKSVDDQFQILLDDFNKGKPDDQKLTKETLTFKVPYKLVMKAHTSYRTENIPNYDLNIGESVVSFEKGSTAYESVSNALTQFINGKKNLYHSTFFIKDK